MTHVGVIALVVLMMNLGFWQLRRLDEKRTFNAKVTARSEMPVDDLTRVFGKADDLTVMGLEWRRVRVTGTYDFGRAVRVVNRSQDGAAGYDEVVPLRTKEFGWVIVNRGFVPLAVTLTDSHPQEPVTVTGYLKLSQQRGVLGAVDSTDITNKDFQRFDIPLMAKQLNGTVFPMYVQLTGETPATIKEWPAPVAFPELSEGPHKSYAIQWFFFCLVALTAWVVVTRRKWRAGDVVTAPTPE